MSEMTYGILQDEVAWPAGKDGEVERHIASGTGWDYEPGERGGGFVPDRNPWKEDPPYENPAQDGTGLLPYRGPGIHGPDRG
ncbi:hypothetical protein [Vulgatibacter sp.]|uniref:hypothetical protein n=1 Tax=Vulgatibacter sp. TaxID=1971226 RepID=UPI00356ACB32